MYGILDIGTTKIKIFIYDKNLNRTYSEYIDNITQTDGTQDPNHIAKALRHFLKVAKERNVREFGVATYRASIIAWDKSGRPISPIYTWLFDKINDIYKTKFKFLQYVPKLGILFKRYSPLFRFLRAYTDFNLGKCLKNGQCFLWTLDAYIAYLLTGKFISDVTNATLTGLIHPNSFRKIPLIDAILGVELPLPEIVDNYGDYGFINGLEFKVMIADQQAACIGEGAVKPEVAKVTLGTGLFVDIPTGVYTEVRGMVPLVLYKVGSEVRYAVEAYLPGAGKFIDMLIAGGFTTYEQLAKLELKGDYIFIMPTLAGLQYPPMTWIRGSILGLKINNNINDVLSSTIATLAYYVKFVLESTKARPKVIRVNGGGARLNSFIRCLSSLVGIDIERPYDYEGTARGVLKLLALGDKLAKLEEPLGSYEKIYEDVLYCKFHYDTWLSKIKYLKNLKPFFLAR